MHTLELHRMTRAFSTRSLRPAALPMGHVLNIDHFHMSAPTFPPHPHAGFSAVTWMLPWSEGGFINRDSFGDRSRIGPGALHWTLAGSGMLHEEIPERPGEDCEGLQMFVKLPEPLETTPPQAFHREPDEIPIVALGGGEARVLVGAYAGAAATIPSHARTTLLHVDVDGEVELAVPAGVEAFALALRGEGRVDGAPWAAHSASALAPGSAHALAGAGLSLLVGWSEPLPGPASFAGPFCMFRRERLLEAREAYARGAMGQLSPSNVRWER